MAAAKTNRAKVLNKVNKAIALQKVNPVKPIRWPKVPAKGPTVTGKPVSKGPAITDTGTPATPGTGAVHFWTPQDLLAQNDQQTQLDSNLNEIDTGLAQQRADTEYNTAQTNKSAQRNTAAATDNMIARGLFRSSIRDGALNDIEANRVDSVNRFRSSLDLATLAAEAKKRILQQNKERFDNAMNQKFGSDENTVPGTPETPAVPGAPAPPVNPAEDRKTKVLNALHTTLTAATRNRLRAEAKKNGWIS